MFSVNFFTWKKFCFWVCLFPTILKTHKLPSKTPKFGGKSNFLPKSSKINKNWFFFKFLRQIFRVPPEVPWVWFLRSYDFFLTKIWDFEQKKSLKKKTKSTLLSKKRYTLNNLGFCIKSALKKIIVTVFEKKKKIVLVVFFFQKFFLFKISYFCQKKSYDLKNYTQCTSGGTLKICRRNLKKNQFLLILVKNFIFDQIFRFVGNIVGVIKSWETDKLKKKFFFK